jgi:hypothetical protein
MERIRSTAELDFEPRASVFPSPADWREQVIYQVLIDRFDDGQDRPPYERETAKARGNDERDGRRFQGGAIGTAIFAKQTQNAPTVDLATRRLSRALETFLVHSDGLQVLLKDAESQSIPGSNIEAESRQVRREEGVEC